MSIPDPTTGERRPTTCIRRSPADGRRRQRRPKAAKSGLRAGPISSTGHVAADVSPDGKTIALITNYPNPFNLFLGPHLGFLPAGRDPLAQVRSATTIRPQVRRQAGGLHLQPALGGGRGSAHRDLHRRHQRPRFLNAAGHAWLSWSPDGKWIAAEKTDGKRVVMWSSSTPRPARKRPLQRRRVVRRRRGRGRTGGRLPARRGDRYRPGPRPRARQSVRHGADHRVDRVGALLDGTSRPAWFTPASEPPTPVPTAPPASVPASSGPSPSGP